MYEAPIPLLKNDRTDGRRKATRASEPSEGSVNGNVPAKSSWLRRCAWLEGRLQRFVKVLLPSVCSAEIADYARNFSPQDEAATAAAPGAASVAIQQHTDIEFSFFSDNFAVSGSADQAELVFKILAFASHELLQDKFLVRGGVTIGNLYRTMRK